MLKKFILTLALVAFLPLSAFAAAITPTTVLSESVGSIRLVIAEFANTSDDADTWDSGLTSIVAFWAQTKKNPTQGAEGISITEASGTFTFNIGEDNVAFTLFVVLRN